MTDRIHFSPAGAYISKPGYNAVTAAVQNHVLYPGMSAMTQVAGGTSTIAGGSRLTLTITNPNGRMPYVILGATDGSAPDRETYCAETSPPFTTVYIRNDVQPGAPARTITYGVLIDNSFI